MSPWQAYFSKCCMKLGQLKYISSFPSMSSGYNMSGCYFETDCDIKNERLGFQVEKGSGSQGRLCISIKDTLSMLIASRRKSSKELQAQPDHLIWKRFFDLNSKAFPVLDVKSTLLNPGKVEPECN